MTDQYHTKHWTRQRALGAAHERMAGWLDEIDEQGQLEPEALAALRLTAAGLRLALSNSGRFRREEQARHICEILARRGLAFPKTATMRGLMNALGKRADFLAIEAKAKTASTFAELATDSSMLPVPRDANSRPSIAERVEAMGGTVVQEADGTHTIIAPNERAADRMSTWADVVRVAR